MRQRTLKHKLTQARLKEVLYYHPESGDFVWINCPKPMQRHNGKQAGTLNTWGYLQIGVDGVTYLAARLAVLYMRGEWPVLEVDHIDRVRTNNAWVNLREATKSRNQCNHGVSRANTSGVTGLFYLKGKRSCWWAGIRMPDGTARNFRTPDKALAETRLAEFLTEREAMFQVLEDAA